MEQQIRQPDGEARVALNPLDEAFGGQALPGQSRAAGGAALESNVIDRSPGALQRLDQRAGAPALSMPDFGSVRSGSSSMPSFGSVRGGSSSNAAPRPPTGQAKKGYPPDSSAQASSQGGAAAPQNTPVQMVERMDPLSIEDTLESSKEAVTNTGKSNPQAAKQAEAALTLKGVDVESAFYDLRDNMMDAAAKRKDGRKSKVYNETEFKKRWKNIFNVIPRDQMGLFLMDFGMRMMAASMQPGNALVHMGMAGSGALAGAQGRQQLEEERALKAEETASKDAAGVIGMQQQQQAIGIDQKRAEIEEQRRLDEAKDRALTKPNDVIWTTEGGMVDRGNGPELQYDKNGKPIQPNLRASGGGQNGPFQFEMMYQSLLKVGYSPRQAMDLIQGSPTEGEARLAFSKIFDSEASDGTRAIPPGGQQAKRLRDFTASERKAYIDSRVNEVTGGGQGALSGVSNDAPQRPANWNKY